MIAIRKNGKTELRIEAKRYGGGDVLDIREWYRDPDGDWRPSKRGTCFQAGKARDVVAAILSELDRHHGE